MQKEYPNYDKWEAHNSVIIIKGGDSHSYTAYTVQEPSTYKTEKYLIKKAYDEPIYQTKCSKCGKIK